MAKEISNSSIKSNWPSVTPVFQVTPTGSFVGARQVMSGITSTGSNAGTTVISGIVVITVSIT